VGRWLERWETDCWREIWLKVVSREFLEILVDSSKNSSKNASSFRDCRSYP
jgi:hypothetical protein